MLSCVVTSAARLSYHLRSVAVTWYVDILYIESFLNMQLDWVLGSIKKYMIDVSHPSSPPLSSLSLSFLFSLSALAPHSLLSLCSLFSNCFPAYIQIQDAFLIQNLTFDWGLRFELEFITKCRLNCLHLLGILFHAVCFNININRCLEEKQDQLKHSSCCYIIQ